MSFSRNPSSCSSLATSPNFPRWSTFFSSSFTLPLAVFGMSSTCCGLYDTVITPLSSSSKNFCASVPLKNGMMSLNLPSVVQSPKFGCNTFARILSAVDFPMPFTPNTPVTLPFSGVGMEYSTNWFSP